MNRDQQSIFGNTYEGVPTPYIPHVHPYPTRYHGPIWQYPEAGLPYVTTPYARAPYAGLGASCTCGSALGATCSCPGLAGSPDGLGTSPDGLGNPMLCASSGSSFVDAMIGAGVGYFAAPTQGDQALWALVGAGAAWLGGLVGIIGVGAAGLYVRNK
jgi:hypothetical protein